MILIYFDYLKSSIKLGEGLILLDFVRLYCKDELGGLLILAISYF